jgi:hypothetical protein
LKKKLKNYELQKEGEEIVPITIKHAIKYTAKAWENVTNQTIINCWKKTAILPDVDENSTEVTSFLDSSRNDDENELQNLINELSFTNPLSGLEYLSIDEMEKNVDYDDLLNEEEIISMLNFNEENQDEEDIEETPPISNRDALLAIEKVNLFVEQQFKEFTNEELKLLKNVKKKIKKIEFNSTKQSKLDRFFNINIE